MPAPPEESEPAMVRAMGVMRLWTEFSRWWRDRETSPASSRNDRHGIGEEQDAGEYKKTAKHLFHGGKMRPEALHGA